MSITKPQLRNRVLVHLGVINPGENPSGHDAVDVDTAIDEAFADLDDIVPFESSAIPDWAVLAMRDYVASIVAPSFGIQASTPPDVLRGMVAARVANRIPKNKRVIVEYY